MKKKTARWMGAVLAAVACSAALLAGCQKKEELPDLSGMGTVVIAAREEGSGAGQKLVPDYGIPVRKVSSFLSDQSQGTIRINGSSSEAPLLKALAEDYKTYNSHAQIQIEVTDSTTGLNKAMDGSCDLAMSSRELKDYEKELLQSQAIAIDGIAVIVNLENPVENLSVEQIRAIYDGKYETWGDLK